MVDFPSDALPPPITDDDPLLVREHDPLGLPAEKLATLGLTDEEDSARPVTLTCGDLARAELWDHSDCCSLCHDHAAIRPEPLRYRHVTVRGCCAAHDALNHLNPPSQEFIEKLFR